MGENPWTNVANPWTPGQNLEKAKSQDSPGHSWMFGRTEIVMLMTEGILKTTNSLNMQTMCLKFFQLLHGLPIFSEISAESTAC